VSTTEMEALLVAGFVPDMKERYEVSEDELTLEKHADYNVIPNK